MKWDGNGSTANGTTTVTKKKAAKRSNDTSALAKQEKKPLQKSQPDGQPKKPKKRRSKLNGLALPPNSLNSIASAASPTSSSEPPCSPLASTSIPAGPGGKDGLFAKLASSACHGEPADREALVRQAMAGDSDAMQQFRELMSECPEIWQKFGDVGRAGLTTILLEMCGPNEFSQEAICCHINLLWQELEGGRPTALLRICIQAVIAASLEIAYLNISYPLSNQGLTLPQQTLLLRRRDSAQRRFSSAVKTLLLVRKHQQASERLPSADGSQQAKQNGHHANGNGHTANGKGCHANSSGAIPAYLQNRFANLLMAEDDA